MLGPSKLLQNTIRIINSVFNYCNTQYWLCFGGLWGLIQNDGVIPDGDLDLCVFYGTDYKRIVKAFESSPGRYKCKKVLVDDTNHDNALYCGFNSDDGYPHICLSFWYKHDFVHYYCHDQHHEVSGIGVPNSGYYFRGVPSSAVTVQNAFRRSEWPGIEQTVKIWVPSYPGIILDNMYPDWAYIKQRYNIGNNHKIDKEKTVSIYKGGACSPFSVHVKSMAEFSNTENIKKQLIESRIAWNNRFKDRG